MFNIVVPRSQWTVSTVTVTGTWTEPETSSRRTSRRVGGPSGSSTRGTGTSPRRPSASRSTPMAPASRRNRYGRWNRRPGTQMTVSSYNIDTINCDKKLDWIWSTVSALKVCVLTYFKLIISDQISFYFSGSLKNLHKKTNKRHNVTKAIELLSGN